MVPSILAVICRGTNIPVPHEVGASSNGAISSAF